MLNLKWQMSEDNEKPQKISPLGFFMKFLVLRF